MIENNVNVLLPKEFFMWLLSIIIVDRSVPLYAWDFLRIFKPLLNIHHVSGNVVDLVLHKSLTSWHKTDKLDDTVAKKWQISCKKWSNSTRCTVQFVMLTFIPHPYTYSRADRVNMLVDFVWFRCFGFSNSIAASISIPLILTGQH